MNDADLAKSNTAQLFDRASERYERTGVDFFSIFGEELVRYAELRSGERVLDVGCGSGAVAFPAARAVGAEGQVLGIDLAAGMVDRCRADAAALGLEQLTVRRGDAESPDVLPHSFDLVLAGLVLFFLPSPDAALAAYRTALTPGGRLAFSTFGPEDERFGAVFGAVAAHIPQPTDAPPPSDPPADSTPARAAAKGLFGSDESIGELLAGLGYQEVQHHHVHHDISFDSPEQWVEWSWSHGARQLWEAVPADALDTARTDGLAALGALADESGGLVHRWVLRYTTAVSPGP